MERLTDKKTIGEKFGNKTLHEKKPPSNNKFKGVAKVIDTGKTINDVQVLGDQYVSKKKNELFKRIKASTVVKLIEENNNTESIYNLADEKEENIQNIVNNDALSMTAKHDNESVYSYKTDKTDLTTKTTVTAITYATEMLGNLSQLSYMLLDLREKSDYDNYHIKEAISFPAPNISRDKFTVKMLSLKNMPDKLIIVYHNDERNSIPHATLLIQKGYDNIFLLSGGIEEFVKTNPEKCDGPGVQVLINMKLQEEILKKDAALKSTKSKMNNTKSSAITPSTTSGLKKVSSVSTKTNVVAGSVSNSTGNKNALSNLKRDLQK